MTTTYFTQPADLAPVNKARSVDINNLAAAVAAAFAAIPNYGQTWQGLHDFTGGTMRVATPVGSTDAATKAYVDALKTYADNLAFKALTLPAQAGNAGKSLVTDGVNPSWKIASSVPRLPRTSNTMLGAADIGSLVDITSGTFTQTFAAAATLGAGWFCYIRNNGTGDVTLDPNAAELIDGLTSFVMYPGESRLIQSDGAQLTSVVLRPFIKAFSVSGTFTKPPGYSQFNVQAIGGGGGGGGGFSGNATANGGVGGSGAGVAIATIPASMVGATEAITVGAGGTGGIGGAPVGAGSANGTAGGTGGISSFGVLLRASGGNGGGIYSTYAVGAAGVGFPNIATYTGGLGRDAGASDPLPSLSTEYAPPGGGQGGKGAVSGGAGAAGGAIGGTSYGWKQIAGGAGAPYAASGGSNGSPGISNGLYCPGTGGGGGGGAITLTAKAGNGGVGGTGAGGGGGGCANTQGGNAAGCAGGDGGAGGNGVVVVSG